MGGRKGLDFGKKYRAPLKRRQQVYSGKSCLCGARLATFSDKSRRRARISGKGRWDQRRRGSLPLPRHPSRRPAATFAGGATAAAAPGRAPAPASLRAALPGETTCCRFGCFSAFRWLFHLPPCSTQTGVTAAPAARAEIPLPSFYGGECGRSTSGLGAGTTGGAQSHERGAAPHRGPRRPQFQWCSGKTNPKVKSHLIWGRSSAPGRRQGQPSRPYTPLWPRATRLGGAGRRQRKQALHLSEKETTSAPETWTFGSPK